MSKQLKHLNMFINFAKKELGLPSLPTIHFAGSEQNSKRAFGHSQGDEITVRINDRHPGDIMRTIAHEMTHFKQNLLKSKGEQMREDEANALAGRLMRKFNTNHPEVFKDEEIDDIGEDIASAIPANVMGASSSTHGTGGIDTFDPLLTAGKTIKRKKLSDIIGPSAMRKDKRRDK
jgi:hypothetical protein